jgi:hypothetical protein
MSSISLLQRDLCIGIATDDGIIASNNAGLDFLRGTKKICWFNSSNTAFRAQVQQLTFCDAIYPRASRKEVAISANVVAIDLILLKIHDVC